MENLLKTVLVGTERQPVNLADTDDALSHTLAQLDVNAREAALLKAAGATALYQRAGRLPVKIAPPAKPASDSHDLPVISQRAELRLRMMLKETRYQPLLPEWLAAVAQNQRRVPALLLPQLLSLGAAKAELREALLPVLGARGHWLAAQHPSGRWVIGEAEDESIWHEGSFEQRCAYFKRLRKRDAERARTLLETTWAQEPPRERAALLALLRTGLGQSEEAFLESALDDKRKEIRTVAADLLAQLPQSGFVSRMRERGRALLIFKRKTLGKNKLEINAPATVDAVAQRDGLAKPAKSITTEQRFEWVREIIAAIPPKLWSEMLQVTPQELAKASLDETWHTAVWHGWKRAALRCPDDEWLTIIWQELQEQLYHDELSALLLALSPTIRHELFWQSLQATKSQVQEMLRSLIQQLVIPWDESTSRALIDWLADYFSDPANQGIYWWGTAFQSLAQSLSPDGYQYAVSKLQPHIAADHNGSPALQHLLDVLQFRYEMLKEINQ